MKKALLTAGVLVIVMAALSACGVGDANKTADDFMTALQGGNYEAAYGLLTPALQQELGDAEGLQAAIPGTMSEWSFTDFSIENNTAAIQGTGQGPDGTYLLGVVLENADGEWRVAGYEATSAQ